MIHHFHYILLATQTMCEKIIQWHKYQEAGIIRAILEAGHTEEKSCYANTAESQSPSYIF